MLRNFSAQLGAVVSNVTAPQAAELHHGSRFDNARLIKCAKKNSNANACTSWKMCKKISLKKLQHQKNFFLIPSEKKMSLSTQVSVPLGFSGIERDQRNVGMGENNVGEKTGSVFFATPAMFLNLTVKAFL